MKLFTLIAGYAVGLAVAMKYRKEAGTLKMDTKQSKLNSFIDEVVDIHKTAFGDMKGFVKENFENIENFDDLQSQVSGMISDFSWSLESRMEDAKKAGIIKKDELLWIAQEFYKTHEVTLNAAKSKAASFTGISEDTIDVWLKNARTELMAAYTKIQSKFSETFPEEPQKDLSVKKPVEKKAHSKNAE